MKIVENGLIKLFFLVTPRSGSSLLSDLLCIHLHPYIQYRLDPKHPDLTKDTCADFFYFLETGFLLNLFDDFKRCEGVCLIDTLKSAGFQFVYLTRRNVLKQTISHIQASSTGIWHYEYRSEPETETETEIKVTKQDLYEWSLEMLRQNAIAEYFFEVYNISPLRIFYEDFLESGKPEDFDLLHQQLETQLGRSLSWDINAKRKKLAGDAREEYYRKIITEANDGE